MQHSIANEQAEQQIRGERKLVARLLAGDREAWAKFVNQYQRVVFSRVNQVLMQYCTSAEPNDSDDVVAELFASLLANDMRMLRRFQHRSTLATWLTIIAHRMSLRVATKLKRNRWKINELDPTSHATSKQSSNQSLEQVPGNPAENPLARLLTLESRSKIRRKLAMLKPADRQVIELFHFENLGYREIASRMGMSENSVGPRLTRAQRRLKRLVEDAT